MTFCLGCSAALSAAERRISDLDILLPNLSLGGFVNNFEVSRVPAQESPAAIEPLRGSADPSVAALVRAMGPAFECIEEAKSIEARLKEINAELARKYGPSLGDILRSMSTPDRATLQRYVQSGQISQRDADEVYSEGQMLRAETFGKFLRSLAATLPDSIRAGVRIHSLRCKAEVVSCAGAADILPPALASRAGPEHMLPALEWKLGTRRSEDSLEYGTHAYLLLTSNEERDLTRVTILLNVKTDAGSRYALLYIPTLPAHGRFRSRPIFLRAGTLAEAPAGTPVYAAVESSTCSIWCDQFRSADHKPELLTDDEFFWESRLNAAAPGLVFLSQPANYAEKPGKFELRFIKLTKGASDARIELKLLDNSTAAPRSKLYRGGLSIPTRVAPSVFRVPSNEDLLASMKASGGERMELTLSFSFDSASSWRMREGPVKGIQFKSAPIHIEDVLRPAADRIADALRHAYRKDYAEGERLLDGVLEDYAGTASEEDAKKAIARIGELKEAQSIIDAEAKETAARNAASAAINQANLLASQGKFGAAKNAYQKICKQYKDTPWEDKARALLEGLDDLKKARANAEKQREDQLKALRRAGS